MSLLSPSTHVLHIEVELRSDVAFRSRAGAGAAVDFVPGLVLLGHMGRHYEAARAQGLHWDIFHSGATRFGDARIVSPASTPTLGSDEHEPRAGHPGGIPARPMPLSFRFRKGVDGRISSNDQREFLQRFPDTQVIDACLMPKQRQWGDKAGAQLWQTGEIARVQRRVDLKTRIRYRTQRVLDGALFNVATLGRGQRFRGRVECANEVVFKFLKDRMAGEARLGWSRRAEYGAATIRILDPETLPEERSNIEWPTAETPALGQQRFVLLSDTCLLDPDTGLPTSRPDGRHFGLDDAALDREQTFLRISRFTPFNAHHRRPSTERVALQAGSVITFNLMSAPRVATPSGLGWVGAHNAEGMGHVWIDAPHMNDWLRALDDATNKPSPPPLFGSPIGELADWHATQAVALRERLAAESASARIIEKLRDERQPSPSQWRRVARVARRVRTPDDLAPALASIYAAGVARHQWKHIRSAFDDAIAGQPPLGVALAAEALARVARRGE